MVWIKISELLRVLSRELSRVLLQNSVYRDYSAARVFCLSIALSQKSALSPNSEAAVFDIYSRILDF